MSISYHMLLAEDLQEEQVMKSLLQIEDIEAEAVEVEGVSLTNCAAPGVDIYVSNRNRKELAPICSHFGIDIGIAVSFDISRDVELYDAGNVYMFTAVQTLLLELSCDAIWLYQLAECLLRRIDGEVTLYDSDIWNPNVEPDLLSRIVFPYRLENSRLPFP